MGRLMILGAGGHGKVVAEIAVLMNKWDEIVFLDDNKESQEVNGHKVIGKISEFRKYKEIYDYAFVGIGNNRFRMELFYKLEKEGFKLPVILHPSATISSNIQIGKGTVVMAGVVVNTNTVIGKGCIINTSSSIDHDCILKSGVHISPGSHIGGTVEIGKYVWVCIGSSVTNNVKIGDNSIVASGAAVVENVEDNILSGGVPSKFIKEL